MSHFRSIADIRREYGDLSLNEESVLSDPIAQFQNWFEEVLQHEKNDPTAMVLSTVDDQGNPDSRVVLLKALDEAGHFIFYTNYLSTKARQLDGKSSAALNFYWPEMSRQVRVRGTVEKVSETDSDLYFASRPAASQLSAIISPQSQEIASRAVLEQALTALKQQQGEQLITRPAHWGGYSIIANEIEFWQGRDNRLHDRIQYYRQGKQWFHHRLAP